MKYRILGRTGLYVSGICLGTMAYGESEKLFGQAIKDTGILRHEMVISTKVRGRMAEGPNSVGLSRKHILHQ